jgi:hypothetical protein
MKRTAGLLPQTIDEYLAPLSDEKRAALQGLRRAIKAAAPKAEECTMVRKLVEAQIAAKSEPPNNPMKRTRSPGETEGPRS